MLSVAELIKLSDVELDTYLNQLSVSEKENLKKICVAEYQKNVNFEKSIKLVLNSIYGATGNQYYYFYNKDVAESITVTGRETILYAEKIINEYFLEKYHLDTELHKKMHIKNVLKINNPVVLYIDTDSNYISFDEVYKNSVFEDGYTIDEITFINQIYNLKIKDYIIEKLNAFAEMNNTKNLHNFEFESISYNIIFLTKKKYIANLAFSKNKIHKPLSNIHIKGFDAIKSNSSSFSREVIMVVLSYILKNGKDTKISDIITILKDYKEKMKYKNIDDISINIKVNGYSKYVLSDSGELLYNKKAPYNVKGVGLYNYLLNMNKKYKNKYSLIKDGEKVKYYYISPNNIYGKDINVFCYIPNKFPLEFAPKVDYNILFYKSVVAPINTLLKRIGLPELDSELSYSLSLFS